MGRARPGGPRTLRRDTALWPHSNYHRYNNRPPSQVLLAKKKKKKQSNQTMSRSTTSHLPRPTWPPHLMCADRRGSYSSRRMMMTTTILIFSQILLMLTRLSLTRHPTHTARQPWCTAALEWFHSDTTGLLAAAAAEMEVEMPPPSSLSSSLVKK